MACPPSAAVVCGLCPSKLGHTEIPRAQRRATTKEIGQAFGLHYATVSRLVRAAEMSGCG